MNAFQLRSGCSNAAWIGTIGALRNQIVRGQFQSSRLGDVVELTGVQVVIDPMLSDSFIQWNPVRKMSPGYAFGELLWYLSGSDQVDGHIARYAPSYKRVVKQPHAFGGYGWRMGEHDQLHAVVSILKKNPDSRQAVVSMWDRGDAGAAANGQEDIPCTLTLQFLLRDSELHLLVNMRSNDAWLGMPYDMFCFRAIQRMVAAHLGVTPGQYIHQVGSLHLYEKHWDGARKVLDGDYVTPKMIYLNWDAAMLSTTIADEQLMRDKNAAPDFLKYPVDSAWRLGLQCCALHLGLIEPSAGVANYELQMLAFNTRLKKEDPR